MKILISAGGMNLPEVLPEELRQIRDAAPGAEIVIASSRPEFEQHLPDAEVVFGGVNRTLYPKATRLRWLHALSAGADSLLYPEMRDSDVILTNEKGLVGEHMADHAFALLLALTRQLRRSILEGSSSWENRVPTRYAMIELTGRVLGIVGLGGTGRAVARRARAFGLQVLAVDKEDVTPGPDVDECWVMERFPEMLARSDVVVICCPLTDETRGLFDDRVFSQMKPGSFIINVARPRIIDDESLLRALRDGPLAGAGLDCTPIEPLPPEHPLWTLPSVVITPHTAGASQFRARRNMQRFIQNLQSYIKQEPMEGIIDRQKGY